MVVVKRDGQTQDYNPQKIYEALKKCFLACNSDQTQIKDIVKSINTKVQGLEQVEVERIQDLVEDELIHRDLTDLAKAYIRYRYERSKVRQFKSSLTQIYHEINNTSSDDMELKRENANIDANTSMGTMLKYGSEAAKDYNLKYLIKPKIAQAHIDGDLHIHDLDFYSITLNCAFLPLGKLLKSGFNTGHGSIREPQSITSAASLACIILQSNQNEMFGGQAFPTLDWDLAPYVAKSWIRNLIKYLTFEYEDRLPEETREELKRTLQAYYDLHGTIIEDENVPEVVRKFLNVDTEGVEKCLDFADYETRRDTHQAMESLVHNLNSMHSRCMEEDTEVLTLDIKSSRDIDKMLDVEKQALKDLLVNLYQDNTLKDIAKELSCTESVIRNIFSKLEIPTRTPKEKAIFNKNIYLKRFGVDNPMKNKDIQKKVEVSQKSKNKSLCHPGRCLPHLSKKN